MTSLNEFILLPTNGFLESGFDFFTAEAEANLRRVFHLELVILISLEGTLRKKSTASNLLNIFEN